MIYHSTAFGDLKISLADPEGEDGRRLFAHYVWNAGVLLAEMICGGLRNEGEAGSAGETVRGRDWSVKGQRVLELGAGMLLSRIYSDFFSSSFQTLLPSNQSLLLFCSLSPGSALPSLSSALSSPTSVVITDYPTPTFSTVTSANISTNIPVLFRSHVSHFPHKWADFSTSFAMEHKGSFTRILAADVLWLPSQHLALLESVQWFLADAADGGKVAEAWVVAGFHTGRGLVGRFLKIAEEKVTLEVGFVREVNVETGIEREWQGMEYADNEEGGKGRWCIIIVLRRRSSASGT